MYKLVQLSYLVKGIKLKEEKQSLIIIVILLYQLKYYTVLSIIVKR